MLQPSSSGKNVWITMKFADESNPVMSDVIWTTLRSRETRNRLSQLWRRRLAKKKEKKTKGADRNGMIYRVSRKSCYLERGQDDLWLEIRIRESRLFSRNMRLNWGCIRIYNNENNRRRVVLHEENVESRSLRIIKYSRSSQLTIQPNSD